MIMRTIGATALILFVLPLVVSSPASAATFHTDDFTAAGDTQQWSGGGAMGTTVVNAGGFLEIDSGGGFLASFNLRTDWTGDFTALAPADKLLVHADLMSPVDSEPLAIRFVLFGNNGSRWTSMTDQALPADGVWRSYTYSLAATALTLVAGAGTHAAMISAVQRVMFRHDPGTPTAGGTGVDGTLNLDNIQLAKVVVPGDFDGDEDVDSDDLNHPTLGWKARFGVDLDGNDFLVWQRHVDDNAPLGATVPEPSAALLAILAIAAIGMPLAVRGLSGGPCVPKSRGQKFL